MYESQTEKGKLVRQFPRLRDDHCQGTPVNVDLGRKSTFVHLSVYRGNLFRPGFHAHGTGGPFHDVSRTAAPARSSMQ